MPSRHVELLWRHGVLLERRADELEQFAGRIAHDVLSPLGAAALGLDVAARSFGEGEPAQTAVERGRRAITRIKRIIDGLLEFARAGASPEPGARAAEVRPVLHDLMDELAPVAEELGAERRVEPFAPCAVAASPGVLTSIVVGSGSLFWECKARRCGAADAVHLRRSSRLLPLRDDSLTSPHDKDVIVHISVGIDGGAAPEDHDSTDGS
jgi:hypothetical protein